MTLRINLRQTLIGFVFSFCLTVNGFADDNHCGSDKALAACIPKTYSDEYYIEQSKKYFLTMDSSVSPFVQPSYSAEVIRWEWPPWLYLTGYGRWNLIWTDTLLKLFPTSYQKIDCRAFDKQPFGRCHVIFDYSGRLCPIYEEFTFNEAGEITFIEAWSDYEGLLPMDFEDTWAEMENVKRLATKVPGLGREHGLINQEALAEIARDGDPDLIELKRRLDRPYTTYFKQLREHTDDLIAGCDPPRN